jgi:thiol:disulfide interchange protein
MIHRPRCMTLAVGLLLVLPLAAAGKPPTIDDLLGSTPAATGAGEGELELTAGITPAAGDKSAELWITAEIPAGWHTFSITQPAGGPTKTRIDLESSPQFKKTGDFKADPAPKIEHSEAFPNVPMEVHEGRVTWRAPIQLADGVDPANVKIKGSVFAQRCLGEEKCLPPKKFKFTATAETAAAKDHATNDGGTSPAPPHHDASAAATSDAARAAPGQYEPKGAHLILRGWLEPSVVAPGGAAKLVIAAEPTDHYHIYALADRDPSAVAQGKPALMVLIETGGFPYEIPQTSERPREKLADGGEGTIRYHDAPVHWTTRIQVPADAKPGDYPVAGVIGFHTCDDAVNCDLPQGAEFQANLTVAPAGAGSPKPAAPLEFHPTSYAKVAALAEQRAAAPAAKGVAPAIKPVAPKEEPLALWTAIGFGLLGGFILNFMPCVLPVVGLKLLSFLEQGGKSRMHVFALNVCYTLGILVVFMVLASLAAFWHFAWGERSISFNIGLTCVVFVMALSFLGVWEIPIPGFVGSGKGVEIAAREGAVGAFAKGILTTILATPCSGPFLGAVFAFCARQPPQTVYLLFGMIGLGMAMPYLVIGAFPRLIRFLPKPGAWMDTFKQFLGFVLLGTVVYLFWTLTGTPYLVPTFALLIGLWFGCWLIGRTPLFASFSRKLTAWFAGALVATAVGVFAFLFLTPVPLEAKPFSQAQLDALVKQGKTVVLDFTANWCPTCQLNSRFVINTEEVNEAIKQHNAVLMVADWSDYGDEVKRALVTLTASESLPVLVVFPGGRADEPIILRDLLTKQKLIEAIEQASGAPKETATAANKNVPAEREAPGMAAMR